MKRMADMYASLNVTGILNISRFIWCLMAAEQYKVREYAANTNGRKEGGFKVKKCYKTLALVIMLTMMLAILPACDNTSITTASDTTTSSSTTASSTTQSNASIEPSTSASATNDPITLTLFIDHTWFAFDKFDDPVAKEYTRQTGVYFDVTRATDETQLPVLIASGDLPDIVYTATSNTITLLSDPNVCWPYNELVARTGVDLNANETEIANNTRPDGNYYALLNAYVSQESIDSGKTMVSPGIDSLAYRTDIYEALGSPPLNTLEDLENVLLASKEMYPEVIPLMNSIFYGFSYFKAQLGIAFESIGFADDGKVQYVTSNPDIIKYYELLNRFYREGLISAEAQTYSMEKFAEVRNSGLSFMQLRSSGEANEANISAASAKIDYRWKLLTHELSDNAVFINSGVGWSGTFITKKCKDPDRAIRFFAWARTDEGRHLGSWGIQGVHWDYDAQGRTVTTDFYRKGIAEGKTRWSDFGINSWIFGDKGDESAFVDYTTTDPDMIDMVDRQKSAASHYKALSDLYFCQPKEGDIQTIYTKLNDMCGTEELKIIFAESEAEMRTAYDTMLAKAKQIGVDKLEEWMNKVHTERTANK